VGIYKLAILFFVVAAIVVVVRGVRQGDRPKTIRQEACLVASGGLIPLSAVLPRSGAANGIFIAVAIVLAIVGLWRGPRASNR
jgi:hypothetical protein